MKDEMIRNYAKLMKELELTGIEITENGSTIRLERGGNAAAAVPQVLTAVHQDNQMSDKSTSEYDAITSPMVGVFYAAPAENADPFVKVGDHVKKGDTVCIIEAMKLMNEVPAERDGIIKEICVNNAQTVEYGTVLFLIGD
ncbi:MAG: acetyl-CoA carboxylase biotin carboxyl carrier protein [Parasporobacterium sp.]|nr:acetyl-CoA carboxylase biotin carboxyl carrier protein [Parasporobacterium sp.]